MRFLQHKSPRARFGCGADYRSERYRLEAAYRERKTWLKGRWEISELGNDGRIAIPRLHSTRVSGISSCADLRKLKPKLREMSDRNLGLSLGERGPRAERLGMPL